MPKTATKGRNKGRTSSRQTTKRRARCNEALERVIAGATYREVARAMEIDASTVCRYVHDALAELRERRLDLADKILDRELRKLDQPERLALLQLDRELRRAADDPDGDLDHARIESLTRTLLSVQARRAKLLGLDSPERQEITHRSTTEDDLASLSDAELLAIEQGGD